MCTFGAVHSVLRRSLLQWLTTQHQIATDLSPRLGVFDVSATRQMHSNYPMLAIAEAGGHSPMHALEEAGG